MPYYILSVPGGVTMFGYTPPRPDSRDDRCRTAGQLLERIITRKDRPVSLERIEQAERILKAANYSISGALAEVITALKIRAAEGKPPHSGPVPRAVKRLIHGKSLHQKSAHREPRL